MVSVAELRRDFEAQRASFTFRDSEASSTGSPLGAVKAASAMLQSSTLSRVSQQVEQLREEVFAGLAQLRRDVEEQMRLAIRREDLSRLGDDTQHVGAATLLRSAQQSAIEKLQQDLFDQQSQQNTALQACREVAIAAAAQGEQLALRMSSAETSLAEFRQNLNSRHIAVIQEETAQQEDLSMESELHGRFVGLKETVAQLRSDVAAQSNWHRDLLVQQAQVESLRHEVSKLQCSRTTPTRSGPAQDPVPSASSPSSSSSFLKANMAASIHVDDRLGDVEAEVRKCNERSIRMEDVVNLAQRMVTITQQSQQEILQDVVAMRSFMTETELRLSGLEKSCLLVASEAARQYSLEGTKAPPELSNEDEEPKLLMSESLKDALTGLVSKIQCGMSHTPSATSLISSQRNHKDDVSNCRKSDLERGSSPTKQVCEATTSDKPRPRSKSPIPRIPSRGTPDDTLFHMDYLVKSAQRTAAFLSPRPPLSEVTAERRPDTSRESTCRTSSMQQHCAPKMSPERDTQTGSLRIPATSPGRMSSAGRGKAWPKTWQSCESSRTPLKTISPSPAGAPEVINQLSHHSSPRSSPRPSISAPVQAGNHC
mmetsp:Transcript_4227/g.7177  ORF Transcript_4227/g.7177 Transcript_4227/m.7177 type:complete len:597 (-) Transcript_4227:39-1829(-)